jgi:hypothetical protein
VPAIQQAGGTMVPTLTHYGVKEIYAELQKTLYGALATFQGREINLRHMLFACSPDLRTVYVATHLNSEKCQELRENPYATLSVLTLNEKLDDYSQTALIGKVGILTDFRDPEVQTGLTLLAARLAMVQMILDSGSLGDYCVLKLSVSRIHFGVYRDLVQNLSKTTLRFA